MRSKKPEHPAVVISLTVPLVPPSVNHYKVPKWKSRGFYVTKEAEAFKKAVAIFAGNAGHVTSACEVAIIVYLGKGMRGDTDNFLKVPLDSLVSAGVIRSDADIEAVSCVRKRDRENPRTEIIVKAR